jgi:lysophospholipase L1-like esterase
MLSALKYLALLTAFVQTPVQTGPVTTIPAIDEAPTKAHSYDWMARHQATVERAKQGNVDLIFVGDSITHGWEGGGKDIWDHYYAPRKAMNLGFGWDRTEHVLWRLDNGEIDGLKPKVAVLLIGVNNVGGNTVDDTVAGTTAVLNDLHSKLRRTKVLLLSIFPWKQTPDDPMRKKANEISEKVAAAFAKEKWVTSLNIGDKFLQPDGTLSRDIMPDYLHPNKKGYQIWAEAMEPTLARLMRDKPVAPMAPVGR